MGARDDTLIDFARELVEKLACAELIAHCSVNSHMAKPGTVIGWKLPSDERERLLQRFPPKYENVVADHVTLRVGATPNAPASASLKRRIVGRADDGKSLECLVVELDGTTDRPDGSTYHITWSLGPGRKARESNDVLREYGWEPIDRADPRRARAGALLMAGRHRACSSTPTACSPISTPARGGCSA